MGTETKKGTTDTKDFKPFLTSEEVQEALEQRHVDLLSGNLNTLRKQLHTAIADGLDPTAKVTRPLVEYLQSSPEGDELFAIWDLQTQNNLQAIEISILDTIKLFLDLCRTPIIRSSGVSLIRRILQQQMRYVYRNLTTPRILLQQSTLKLLVSMNSFSSATTRELMDTFNFQLNGFTKFCNFRRKDNNNATSWKYDLRTSYVEFVLAFFKFGDTTVKKDILQVKDLVSPIFKGLERDAYPLIEMVLSVMYEHFIMDQSVPRTTKISLFNNYVLDQLAKVYARQTEDATSPTENDIPANLVHHFLISICCTPGIGICFYDAGWYPPTLLESNKKTSGDNIKIRNKILGHFIKGLRVSEDLRQQELLVKILKACPELTQGYWQSTSLTFEPRLSSNWIANMAVLQKILSIAPPSLLLGKTQFYPTTTPNYLTIVDNILPACLSRNFLSKGLQHSSGLVRYMTILTLTASMKKLEAVANNIEHVISTFEENELGANVTSQAEKALKERSTAVLNWRGCLRKVCDELCRRLPGVQLLAALYSQAISPVKDETTDVDNGVMEEKSLMQDTILRLIVQLQKLLPEVMVEAKFDFSNFIPSDISAVKTTAQIHLLELLLTLSDFRWSNRAAGSSKSHLHGLLSLLLSTSNKHVATLTRKLLVKTLSDTFMFNHDSEEINIWLDSLPRKLIKNSEKQEASSQISDEQMLILNYLDDCINRFTKAQYKYMDSALEIVKQTNSEIQADSENERLALSILNQSSLIDRQPFSPLLITFMEQFGYVKDGSEVIARFIHSLYVRLLGKQIIAGYLSNVFHKYMEKHIKSDANVDYFRKQKQFDSQAILSSTSTLLRGILGSPKQTKLSKLSTKSSNVIPRLQVEGLDISSSQLLFLQELRSLPVDDVHQSLPELCHLCQDKLGWLDLEPLIEYFEERHPAAGSIFQYSMLYRTTESASKLWKQLPFEVIFYNVTKDNIASPFVLETLKHSVANLDGQQLVAAAYHVLLLLSSCEKIATKATDCVKGCFLLLDEIQAKANFTADKNIMKQLSELIFKHPALIDSYLDSSKSSSFTMSSDDIQALVVKYLIPKRAEVTKSVDIKILHLPYTIQVVNHTLDVIHSSQTGDVNKILNEKVRWSLGYFVPYQDVESLNCLQNQEVKRVQLFCEYLAKEDLLSIIRSLLKLYESQKKQRGGKNIVYMQQFSSLLTITSVALYQNVDEHNDFEEDLLTALFTMWENHPTDDLDHLIANILEWSSIPDYLPGAMLTTDLLESYERRIFIKKHTSISSSAVGNMLKAMNAARSRILSTLMKYRADCREVFIEHLVNGDAWQSISLDLMAPVMLSFLSGLRACMQLEQPESDLSVERNTAIESFLRNYQEPLFQSLLLIKNYDDGKNGPSIAARLLSSLVGMESSVDLPTEFISWCKDHNTELATYDIATVFSAFFDAACNDNSQVTFATEFLNQFLVDLRQIIEKQAIDEHKNLDRSLELVSRKLARLRDQGIPDIDTDTVQEYILAVILDGLESSSLISFTSVLINLMKHQYNHDEPVSTYLRNIIEHAEFKRLTAREVDETQDETTSKQRENIILLVYSLTEARPTAMVNNLSLLDPLLCSYGATTELCDQLILSILLLCEKHSSQSVAGKALLFGPGSDKTRQYHAERGLMFNNAALVNESLNLLDPTIMFNTVNDYPVDLALERSYNFWDITMNKRSTDGPVVYDPAFMLPLLSTLLMAGTVDCRKFLECNAVGLMLVSLSSNDNNVRKVGYMLLDDYYVVLQHAEFREQKQIMLLMNALRNAITERDQDNTFKRMPLLITAFAAQAIPIIFSPAHFMYPKVNVFLLQRQLIDIEDIPLFYKLFNTASEQHKQDRNWILRLLGIGLHNFEDHRIYKRRHVYDLITAFFDSKLADNFTKRLILNIFWKATDSPSITLDLARNSGLLSWLHQLAASVSDNDEIHLVCSKLLLKVLRSLQSTSHGKRWMTGVPHQQIAAIATTLLRSIETEAASDTSSALLLCRKVMLLLQTYYRIALNFGDNHLQIQPMRIIMKLLHSCEGYLAPVELPISTSRDTLLEFAKQEATARTVDFSSEDRAAFLSVYQLIIHYLLELHLHRMKFSETASLLHDDNKEIFRFLQARSIPLGIGHQTNEWMISCINSLS